MIRDGLNNRNYVAIGLLMALIGLMLMVYMCASQVNLTKQYRQSSFQVEVLR